MAKLLLLGQLTLMSWMVQAAAPVEVEDVMGRKVSLSLPASRIVLGFYPEDYLAVAGEGGADRLVGMSRGWFVKSRPAIWSLYVASLPQLTQVPDLGNVQDQSFSIEKTLAVRPDVVILAQWQYEALAPDLPRLEQAGIPVVVVDYNAQTLSRHMASTLLLGKVTGQEARARKMADEYKAKIETITSRIAKAKRQPPRVYIELGDKGPAEYSYTYGKDMWGAMALLAGGDNVAAPFVERWGPIHPEQLLASKPEVILMAGYESVSSEQAMQVGQDISAQTVRQRLQGFAARAGAICLRCSRVASMRSITAPPAASWTPPSSSSWPRRSTPTCSKISTPWPPIRASTTPICQFARRAPLCWVSSNGRLNLTGRTFPTRVGKSLFVIPL
ncbi:ABC transporter substrate-binding protein [Aeromonas salmonicida]|uniref:ABC transporter substrate-binding protein n=2 Tax=Aeromonas TaxID=642 RepID=UPI001FB0BE01|nr:ABC transporter substrate-binding protein [Aeromonas salmonicida]